MNVIFGLNDLPLFRKPVITIGSFDGIHSGHRKIIEQLCSEAKKVGGESIVLTFEPHPRYVVGDITQAPKLLHTLKEKIDILDQYELDYLIVIPFSSEFANQEARQYIEDFLVKNFHPEVIVMGYDHHFGKNRTGNIHLLRSEQQKYHYRLLEISAEEVNEMAISSSRIRRALLQGDVEEANQLLCSPYSIRGKAIKGDQRGRTIGFPTANMKVYDEHKLIPSQGVYAVRVFVRNKEVMGMMNIGTRPTITDEKKISIEVHLLNFNEDIYDEDMEVRFMFRIRNEMKFASIEELKHQLIRDRQRVMDSMGRK